jgi:hypothetical protein
VCGGSTPPGATPKRPGKSGLCRPTLPRKRFPNRLHSASGHLRSSLMASPVGEREARLERPLRVGLVLLLAALIAMVFTACGGGGADDGAKVEVSLQRYLNTLDPQQSLGQTRPASGLFPVAAFPIGAGPPRVRENGCKKIHTGKVRPPRAGEVLPALLDALSGWSCVVRFGRTALPVAVAVKGSDEVYWAAPVSRQALPAATVYEGGP